MKPPPLPRLLLVEDDPVSAAYLRDALDALPAAVDVAGSIAQAVQLADAGDPHALYLIDANLPDGRGEGLLRALRDRGLHAAALAHTAAADPPMRERLLAAGFAEVLCKPIGVAGLHAAVRARLTGEHSAARGDATPPAWDDDAARKAVGGQAAHVASLRGLFLQELPGQRARILAAASAGDAPAVRAELHRLLAGCGFVGAARLLHAVRDLQAEPLSAPLLQRLCEATDELLAA